jgi:hypothetical protein
MKIWSRDPRLRTRWTDFVAFVKVFNKEIVPCIPWILLFILCFIIVLVGFNDIFSLLPNTWGRVDEYGDFNRFKDTFPYYVSFFFVAICFALYISLRNKMRYLRDAIHIIICSDSQIVEKVINNKRGKWEKDIDIPLTLIMEKQNKFHLRGYNAYPYRSPHNKNDNNTLIEVADMLGRGIGIFAGPGGELLEELNGYEYFHAAMIKLDNLLQKHVNESVKNVIPRALLNLRYNLLSMFMEASLKHKYLILQRSDFGDNEEAIFELCKYVLNEYYEKHSGHENQKADFKPRELERVLGINRE